jgi:hypothetical protein
VHGRGKFTGSRRVWMAMSDYLLDSPIMSVPQSPDALAGLGYLPVELSQTDGHIVLVLQKLADIEFDQPFYDRTRVDSGGTDSVTVPLDAFMAAIEHLPWPHRPRMVCHTGRCGSTLLANMLALSRATIVLKEPSFLNVALVNDMQAQESGKTVTWDLTVGLLKYCTYVASSSNRLLVVKASSWTAVDLLTNVRPITEGAWLSLWRDPVAVVASQLSGPPRWSTSALLTSLLKDMPAEATAGRDQVELFVSMWSRAAKAFIASAESQRVLSYDQLVDDPRGALGIAEQWLGVIGEPAEHQGLSEVLSRYSKDDPRYARSAGAVPRKTLSVSDRGRIAAATSSLVTTLRRLSGGDFGAAATMSWP